MSIMHSVQPVQSSDLPLTINSYKDQKDKFLAEAAFSAYTPKLQTTQVLHNRLSDSMSNLKKHCC